MDQKHCNELSTLSQEIYDQAREKLTNYCASRYCAIGNDTMEQQLEDFLFVAEETSAYLLGNALALLAPESREKEIQDFSDHVRKIVRMAEQKADGDLPS